VHWDPPFMSQFPLTSSSPHATRCLSYRISMGSFIGCAQFRKGLVARVPGYRSRGLGFDFRCFQIFWEVVGLESGPLSLVSTIEELLERKSSGSGLGNREYGRGDPLRWPRSTLYPQNLALTSSTSGGRFVGIVRSRTKVMEFSFYHFRDQRKAAGKY
jgi:hypothetical protein